MEGVVLTPFNPGTLSREQSDRLNKMHRMLDQLSRISATSPLTISKIGGTPNISIAESYEPILAEITGNDGHTPPVHTAKRKTRNSSNAIVDLIPATSIPNVLAPDGSTIATGTLVNLIAITDWPLPEPWWWAHRLVGNNQPRIVRLVATGTGLDGGTAWRAMVQK